ncbi:MAG: preprotein translocase subunit SecE [Patescibacteria group bacterium]
MIQKIKRFFLEARQELRHVNWPTRQEATRLTSVVILLSLAIAVFLGAFDALFSYLLQNFLIK